MDILQSLFPCCIAPNNDEDNTEETTPLLDKMLEVNSPTTISPDVNALAEETSTNLFNLILNTPTLNDTTFHTKFQNILTANRPISVSSSASSWWIQAVIKHLYSKFLALAKKTWEHAEHLKEPLRNFFIEAKNFAIDFQVKHPNVVLVLEVLIAIAAVALLVEVLAPAVLEAIGFGAEGVVEGSFAAWWQSLYPDVPYGSLFAQLQSLAARCGKTLR